jgi:hypothetical protein
MFALYKIRTRRPYFKGYDHDGVAAFKGLKVSFDMKAIKPKKEAVT